jgi:hypothetical protein
MARAVERSIAPPRKQMEKKEIMSGFLGDNQGSWRASSGFRVQ